MKVPYKVKLVKMLIKGDKNFETTEGDSMEGTKCFTIWWKA